jgi:23S rRNA G2445 N2-methylase RlmL
MSVQFLAKPQRFIVEPAPGWADVTLDEVREILTAPVQAYKFKPEANLEGSDIVVSGCDFRQAMELVMRVTTAHDVLWVAGSKRVSARSDWSLLVESSGILEFLPAGQGIQLSVRVTHPVAGTEKEVKDTLKALMTKGGLTVEPKALQGAQAVFIDSQKNRTRLCVSMGGRPLYQRGYKKSLSGAVAPLAEHHAAAAFRWVIREFGDDVVTSMREGHTGLVVPFAGTGTLGFEALSQVLNAAPALTREAYGFEYWSFVPRATITTIRKRLRAAMVSGRAPVVFGDLNGDVVGMVRENGLSYQELTGAKLDITAFENDFLADPGELCRDLDGVFLPLNPPYGLRLAKKSGGAPIYAKLGPVIGDLGKRHTLHGYVLCPDEASWSGVLKSLKKGFESRTRHFSHGGLDIRCVAFRLIRR